MFDAELVGDRDHGDLVADLAFLLHLAEGLDDAVDQLRRQAEPERHVRPALGQSRRLVGVGGDGEMRIAELVEDRRGGEVHAGRPRRQDEIDLVLRRQTLDRLDHLF